MLLGTGLIINSYCEIKKIKNEKARNRVLVKYLKNENYRNKINKAVFAD